MSKNQTKVPDYKYESDATYVAPDPGNEYIRSTIQQPSGGGGPYINTPGDLDQHITRSRDGKWSVRD